MNETSVVAAILTVAFYTGRGGAMGLPQIIATYHEICELLEAERPKRRAGGRKRR